MLAQAVADAVPVIGIMAAFGAFNSVVAHHELLRSAPRAFHEPALVVTVAITLVPATMRAFQDTREADQARAGRAGRRGRITRTLLPVLETGMERAVAWPSRWTRVGSPAGRRPPWNRSARGSFFSG